MFISIKVTLIRILKMVTSIKTDQKVYSSFPDVLTPSNKKKIGVYNESLKKKNKKKTKKKGMINSPTQRFRHCCFLQNAGCS